MKDLKVIFMGTPKYAVPVLERLIEYTNVIGVVTQPDKLVGRKKIITPSAVKLKAMDHNIEILQPVKIKEEYLSIIDLNPEIIITCAYGQIIPEELINYPKYKVINVHGSLLPKYRGGAPIERSIMNGDKKTGITIMYTDKGMDSGDMIIKEELIIEDNDNLDTLKEKMSVLGAELLMKILPDIINGTAPRCKQKENEATFAYTIKREEEHLDFSKSTSEVLNHIRALSSIPGAYSILDDKEIKIYEAKIGNSNDSQPGKIINIYKDGIGIATKDGEIIITKIQVPGKKIMLVRDYLNGIDKNNLINKFFI